jgi:SulP family sulfate permease
MIEQIPLAALVGVMFMVVVGTFAWQSLTILRRIPLTDALVMGLVTVVTVLTDLAIAVIVGVIVSALAYAWNNAIRIYARTEFTTDGIKIYLIEGPLFFGSVEGFSEIFNPQEDPEQVIVDFINSRVVDQSALQGIEDLALKYKGFGKTLHLRHLSRDCHKLLVRAGQLVEDSDDDPYYGIAVDYRVKAGVLSGRH